MARMMITMRQWQRIERVLSAVRQTHERNKQPQTGSSPAMNTGGRPRRDEKLVLEGVLWVLMNKRTWGDVPKNYPSAATCIRYLKKWRDMPYDELSTAANIETCYNSCSVWDVIWIHFVGNLSKPKMAEWSAALYERKIQSSRFDKEWLTRSKEIFSKVYEEGYERERFNRKKPIRKEKPIKTLSPRKKYNQQKYQKMLEGKAKRRREKRLHFRRSSSSAPQVYDFLS